MTTYSKRGPSPQTGTHICPLPHPPAQPGPGGHRASRSPISTWQNQALSLGLPLPPPHWAPALLGPSGIHWPHVLLLWGPAFWFWDVSTLQVPPPRPSSRWSGAVLEHPVYSPVQDVPPTPLG